jgi:hypothetical protein
MGLTQWIIKEESSQISHLANRNSAAAEFRRTRAALVEVAALTLHGDFMQEKARNYLMRGWHWLHDTLVLVGIITLFIACGGLSLLGYNYYFELVPPHIAQQIAAKK